MSGTSDFGMWYSKDTNTNMIGFSISDRACDVSDRKSILGAYFYVGTNPFSFLFLFFFFWCRKQNCVPLSTPKAEYVAPDSCCGKLMWMKQMIEDYGLSS